MTNLRREKPLRRETSIFITVRRKLVPLIMDIYPGYTIYRPKGCRASGGYAYMVPHDTAWRYGAKLIADQRIRERRAKRKAAAKKRRKKR